MVMENRKVNILQTTRTLSYAGVSEPNSRWCLEYSRIATCKKNFLQSNKVHCSHFFRQQDWPELQHTLTYVWSLHKLLADHNSQVTESQTRRQTMVPRAWSPSCVANRSLPFAWPPRKEKWPPVSIGRTASSIYRKQLWCLEHELEM